MAFFEGFNEFCTSVTKYLKATDLVPKTMSTSKWDIATETAQSDLIKRETIAKLISSVLGISVSMVITYFGFKFMMNAMDPTRKEKNAAQKQAQELMRKIGVSNNIQLSEYEMCVASNLVDPLSMTISWKDIGGLSETIEEIKQTVIIPFKRNKLFQGSSLIQPPKGCLLYGPPGCGKTLIAKATAKTAGARFINLQVSSLFDKWYGESQKRAQAVFSLAMKLQPVIIFIDEIDSFLRSRSSTDHEATAMMKTQFMSFWDGVITDKNCRVMIMGATNRPGDVDAAILRRMPSMFHIGLPNEAQRNEILKVILEGEPMGDDLDLQFVASQAEGYSGSDLNELCRTAALYRVREYLDREMQMHSDSDEDGFHLALENREDDEDIQLRDINTKDFEKAVKKMKETKTVTSFIQMQQYDVD